MTEYGIIEEIVSRVNCFGDSEHIDSKYIILQKVPVQLSLLEEVSKNKWENVGFVWENNNYPKMISEIAQILVKTGFKDEDTISVCYRYSWEWEKDIPPPYKRDKECELEKRIREIALKNK